MSVVNKPMPPGFVANVVSNVQTTLELYSKNGASFHKGVAEKHVAQIKQRVSERCADPQERGEALAAIDELLEDFLSQVKDAANA